MTITQKQLNELKTLMGGRLVRHRREELETFATDGLDRLVWPEVVVEPEKTAQVQAVLRFATRHGIPVTPRGTGTGLSGGALAVHGGILLSLARMTRVLEIDERNLLGVVEPGVINYHYQELLAEKNLFYPPDPASYETCSLGGNVAEDAGGPHCFKYGTTRNYILELETVFPDGSLHRLGVRTRKGVVGYDLKDLFIGSEGTLGVVTRIVTRLLPRPRYFRLLLAMLPHFAAAAAVINGLVRRRIIPSALEFMDENCLELGEVGKLLPLPAGTGALLYVELDGSDRRLLEDEQDRVGEVLLDEGALDVLVAEESGRRRSLWQVRREMSTTIKEKVGLKVSEDVVVPVSRLLEFLERTRELGPRYGVRILHYGHLGDGNVHTNVLHRRRDPEALQQVYEAVGGIFRVVLELGGTISGEHGVGTAKRDYISWEIPAPLLLWQRRIKQLFDPRNIMNPGKIFPDAMEVK